MDTHGLAEDESDGSEDDASPEKMLSEKQSERTPSEHHPFLFRHNLSPSGPNLRDLRPLPSQIPFLLEVFSENVNVLLRIVHMPTVAKMVRDLRHDSATQLAPSNEALMFSIFYATVISMEEDEVSP